MSEFLPIALPGTWINPAPLTEIQSIVPLPAVVDPSEVVTPTTTTVSGYVYDMNGAAVQNATVSFKVLSPPQILATLEPQSYGLTTQTVGVRTATDGSFSIVLVEGATVDVFIPAVNYRRVITVPADDVNLFDIP